MFRLFCSRDISDVYSLEKLILVAGSTRKNLGGEIFIKR